MGIPDVPTHCSLFTYYHRILHDYSFPQLSCFTSILYDGDLNAKVPFPPISVRQFLRLTDTHNLNTFRCVRTRWLHAWCGFLWGLGSHSLSLSNHNALGSAQPGTRLSLGTLRPGALEEYPEYQGRQTWCVKCESVTACVGVAST